jgi:hypothetical protein
LLRQANPEETEAELYAAVQAELVWLAVEEW